MGSTKPYVHVPYDKEISAGDKLSLQPLQSCSGSAGAVVSTAWARLLIQSKL